MRPDRLELPERAEALVRRALELPAAARDEPVRFARDPAEPALLAVRFAPPLAVRFAPLVVRFAAPLAVRLALLVVRLAALLAVRLAAVPLLALLLDAVLLDALLLGEADAAVPLAVLLAREVPPRFAREVLPLLEARRLRAAAPALELRVSPELRASVSPSSSWPISFFATPTAAGTATPIAAPATIFFVVDIPSSSASISHLPRRCQVVGHSERDDASLNDSMKRGTIRSRTTSGAF